MGTLKEQGIIWLVGGFLGMADVAVYDLANKIVTLPRIVLMKMNDALFPKIAVRSSAREIRRIMWAETVLSLLAILTIAAIGKWLVLWLGHGELPAAYPVSIILSLTILFWMLGTSFINFVFVPTNNYYLVTLNQAVSLVTCMGAATIWLTFAPSVYGIAAALAFAGFCEVLFCSISTHKKRLLI
jgi:PST family polysaccharide transporter